MTRLGLLSAVLALAAMVIVSLPAVAAQYPAGVGGHSTEVYCDTVQPTFDILSGNMFTPRYSYMAVSHAMSAAPVATPQNQATLGSPHWQYVAARAWLQRQNSAGGWDYVLPQRTPWWGRWVGYEAQFIPEFVVFGIRDGITGWTNLDMPNYPYRQTRFTISEKGDYRVVVQYYWYADTLAPSGYLYELAGNYLANDGVLLSWDTAAGCHFDDPALGTTVVGGTPLP